MFKIAGGGITKHIKACSRSNKTTAEKQQQAQENEEYVNLLFKVNQVRMIASVSSVIYSNRIFRVCLIDD